MRFAIPGQQPEEYYLVESRDNCSNLSERYFEVGQTIQINTMEDNFTCSVVGKVFRDDEGAPIRATVSKEEGREV